MIISVNCLERNSRPYVKQLWLNTSFVIKAVSINSVTYISYVGAEYIISDSVSSLLSQDIVIAQVNSINGLPVPDTYYAFGARFISEISDVNIIMSEGNSAVSYGLSTSVSPYIPGVSWGDITGTLSNQSDLQTSLNTKQATLVSGTNIKTINGSSVLGAGNLVVSASAAWGGITGTLSNQTDLQSALDGKVDENVAIVAATKTKITYDAKGLVTSGADATTADIADSLNKRYVTDANLTVIGNTSGTNTGDETNATIKTKLGAASALNDGYLTSADWSTFNGKQDAIGFTPLTQSQILARTFAKC